MTAQAADRTTLKSMPGDAGLPILGYTYGFATGRFTASHDRYDRYGPVSWSRALGRTWINAETPDAVGEILQDRDKAFDASGWSFLIGPFFRRGLMLLDGHEHHAHRRIMQGAFTAQRLAGYLDPMNDTIARGIAQWPSGELRFHPTVKQLTLDVATRTFTDVATGPGTPGAERINTAFVDAVRAGTALVRRPVPGLRWAKGLAGRRVLEDYLHPQLAAKRAGDGADLFSALCQARDEDGAGFTDDDVVNHMIFLLMAAHDTATITMTSMAYFLAKHPEWQDRCLAESQTIGGPVPYERLDELVSLDLVMKESLRIVTPVPGLIRRANKDTELQGFRVSAGDYLSVHLWGLHHLDEVWPDPDRFDPERFAEHRREDRVHRYAYLPFGNGIHKCIGMFFGGMEVKAAMHQLLLRKRLEIPDGYELDLDWTSLPRPRDGLPVRLVDR